MDELTELRAALIQLAKTLEIERACVLRIEKIVERRMGVIPPPPFQVVPARETVVGVVEYKEA